MNEDDKRIDDAIVRDIRDDDGTPWPELVKEIVQKYGVTVERVQRAWDLTQAHGQDQD